MVTETGSSDPLIDDLLTRHGVPPGAWEQARLAITGVLELGKDEHATTDLKLVCGMIDETAKVMRAFAPYRERRKVTVFGSSRVQPGDPGYESARRFGSLIAEQGWLVVNGAGPGVMEAVSAGAGVANTLGVNIRLRSPARANAYIADERHVAHKYFFSRKIALVKESQAFVLFPGGLGTADEAFELITLMQYGKTPICPIVLVDDPGRDYWRQWLDFVQRQMVAEGHVKPATLSLLRRHGSAEAAVREVTTFYENFRGLRRDHTRWVIQLRRVPPREVLDDLGGRFDDILGGPISAVDTTAIQLPFDGKSFGRLRELIDLLNASPAGHHGG